MPSSKGSRLDSMKSQRESAGHSITGLAKRAAVSDRTVITLENGGSADAPETQRIADALGVSLATLGQAKL